MSNDFKIIKASDMSHDFASGWQTVRATNPALYSPYFHPDYTRRIGQLKNDAYVAIQSHNDEPSVIFPYQGPKPGKSGFARPIGSPMTDYHGFISAPDTHIYPQSFLKQAGIGAFHYDAVLADAHISADAFSKYHSDAQECAVVTLDNGAQAWRQSHTSSYRRHLKSQNRRARKVDTDFGGMRAEFCSRDEAVFAQLMAWKTQQFETTGKYNVLSVDWTQRLIKELWDDQGELRCDMHVLYFNDRIASIDLGLTDGDTFHSWIVGYDDELSSYAPGMLLLEALITESGTLGYSRIDLGPGTHGYKRHYATSPVTCHSGLIPVKGSAGALASLYDVAEQFGKQTLGDAPGKLRRRYTQIAACDTSLSGRAQAMISAFKSAAD